MTHDICEVVHPLTGRWRVVGEYYLSGRQWKLLAEYNGLIWEFTEDKRIPLPSGQIYHEGRLTESFRDCPDRSMAYGYLPAEKRLYVDRPQYAPGGFQAGHTRDVYFTAHDSGNKYLLFRSIEDCAGFARLNRAMQIIKLRE